MLYAPSEADEAVRHARAMFRRVLTGWAMDLLSLRRAGLDRPCIREGSGLGALTPGGRLSGAGGGRRPSRRASRWAACAGD